MSFSCAVCQKIKRLVGGWNDNAAADPETGTGNPRDFYFCDYSEGGQGKSRLISPRTSEVKEEALSRQDGGVREA